MRPLQLSLEGFRSYAARTEIDWRGSRLVGVVGPIGSGKSSLLDAIAFALFGVTPGERSNTKALIHQRADIAQVELVFSVDDQVWRSVRAIRRSGQSEHALYRYLSDQAFVDGEKPLETVVKKGEVDARIRVLLGMDFEAFGRSALLAQGRFAELLRATPTQRDDVLKGVFGFDRIAVMEQIAKARRDDAARDLDELARRSETFSEDMMELETAKAEASRAERTWQLFEELAPVVEELEKSQVAVAQELTACTKELDSLGSVAARMPDAEESSLLLLSASDGDRVLVDLDKRKSDLDAARLAAAEQESRVLASVGGESAFAEAQQLVTLLGSQTETHEQATVRNDSAVAALARAEQGDTDAQIANKAAQSNEALAAKALAAGVEMVANAQELVHSAEHADMAASLREGLEVGHECPVCFQSVATLEVVAPDGATETARAGLADALLQQAGLQTGATEAREARAKAEAQVVSAATQVSELAERLVTERIALDQAADVVSTTRSRLVDVLGEGDPVAILEEKAAELKGVRSDLNAVSEELRGLDLQREQHLADAKTRSFQLASLRSKLADVAGRIDLEIEVAQDPEGVENDLRTIRETWKQRRQDLVDSQHALEMRAKEAARVIEEKRASVDFDRESSWAEAVADARVRLERARTQLSLRQERIDAAGSLGDDMKAAEETLSVYTELAKELLPSRFLNYLLEEERAALAELGSHQLEDLTGGRFRFSDDGDFAIVDLTAAEQVRKSDTLSGGETFLASLALALALAEMMARSGGRIDAFFLDEGFGSLDPEHLDLALAGIERLVAADENRLVVLVSHVPDMVDRIENLITLDKDPITGATRVIV